MNSKQPAKTLTISRLARLSGTSQEAGVRSPPAVVINGKLAGMLPAAGRTSTCFVKPCSSHLVANNRRSRVRVAFPTRSVSGGQGGIRARGVPFRTERSANRCIDVFNMFVRRIDPSSAVSPSEQQWRVRLYWKSPQVIAGH